MAVDFQARVEFKSHVKQASKCKFGRIPPLEKAHHISKSETDIEKIILAVLSKKNKMAQQTMMNGPAMDGDYQKTDINSQSLVRCFVE